MATESSPSWSPGWRVAPGEVLAEALQERGLTQSDLARRMDRPVKTINEIVNGKASITPDTAIQLERTLGISAAFWNNLETRYREHIAQERAQSELDNQSEWLRYFPVRQLAKLGLVRQQGSGSEVLLDLLTFMGVTSPEAWERQWSRTPIARRQSHAFTSSPHATSVWLRWGELVATQVNGGPFDDAQFTEAIKAARSLSRVQPFTIGVTRLQKLFKDAGVIVVLLPEIQGSRLSGAVRWIGDRALIQLSLRHKTDDQFWFALFHECGHLKSSPKGREFVDSPTDVGVASASGDDLKADEFARETLIPSGLYEAFVASGDLGPNAVRAFAQDLDIAPGIVVGRLQHDGHVRPGTMNYLKERYQWTLTRTLVAKR